MHLNARGSTRARTESHMAACAARWAPPAAEPRDLSPFALLPAAAALPCRATGTGRPSPSAAAKFTAATSTTAATVATAVTALPFVADADDHCETPAQAYADVAPALHALAAALGKAGAGLRCHHANQLLCFVWWITIGGG
jgi:hypothetical protein